MKGVDGFSSSCPLAFDRRPACYERQQCGLVIGQRQQHVHALPHWRVLFCYRHQEWSLCQSSWVRPHFYHILSNLIALDDQVSGFIDRPSSKGLLISFIFRATLFLWSKLDNLIFNGPINTVSFRNHFLCCASFKKKLDLRKEENCFFSDLAKPKPSPGPGRNPNSNYNSIN